MNKNQKIAIGCGGAGCLGLIVLVVVGVVVYLNYRPSFYSNRNYNLNSNRNSNSNSNYNRNSNSNSSSSSSMSNDDKHKLFQAAGMTRDNDLIQKVLRKLGFITDSGVSDDYQ